MTVYTEASDVAALRPVELAKSLRELTETAAGYLKEIPAAQARVPLAATKWSVQEIVGHLIDSAANNTQRIVRLQLQAELSLPGYQQEAWVSVQRYNDEAWSEVQGLFVALNRHLAHVIEHSDPATYGHVWHFDEGDLTLGFVIEDYIAHLRHHLLDLPGFAL